jgi:hypothetical protein
MCARKYDMCARKYRPFGHKTEELRNDVISSSEVAGFHITAPIKLFCGDKGSNEELKMEIIGLNI